MLCSETDGKMNGTALRRVGPGPEAEVRVAASELPKSSHKIRNNASIVRKLFANTRAADPTMERLAEPATKAMGRPLTVRSEEC